MKVIKCGIQDPILAGLDPSMRQSSSYRSPGYRSICGVRYSNDKQKQGSMNVALRMREGEEGEPIA